jgi:hypothetical protein
VVEFDDLASNYHTVAFTAVTGESGANHVRYPFSTPAELAESDEYEKHKGEAERLGRELQSTHEDFEDIVDTFRDIERNSG